MRPVRRQHARMSLNLPMFRTDSNMRRSSSSHDPIPTSAAPYDPPHSLPPTPQSQPHRRRYRRRVRNSSFNARTAATAFAAAAAATTVVVPGATASSLPSIDFGQLGNSAVVGSFAGLESWTPTSQRSNNGTSSLLARTPNGTLFPLAETNRGGTVDALCEMPGLPTQPTSLYAAGNFTSINGVSASNIAHWQPLDGNGGTWNPLAEGLPGPVHALYCDASHQTVVAGGNFSGSLSIWNTTSLTWQDQPYPTLDGPVLGLAPGKSDDTTQVLGGFSIQLASPGAGGNSSASPITSALRPVSMAGATIGVSASGRGEARDLLCPQVDDGNDGGTFLWPDGNSGTITIDFLRTVQARALRLGNTFANGRGSRNFSLTTSGSDTPLALIYADTATGLNATCSAACPLTTNPTIPYQDFLFADAESSPTGTVDLSLLTVRVDSWIGAGPGLHLLQLLGPGATAHANRGYNRGVCNSTQAGAGSSTSSVSTTGSNWRHRAYATGTNTTEGYLRSVSGGSITFNLDVQVDGNYTVYLTVPGCDNTGTCGSGAALSAHVHFNSSAPDATAHIDAPGSTAQTTRLYDGSISAPTTNWAPSVTITVDDSTGGSATATLGRVDAVLRNSTALPPAAIRGFGLLEANLYAPVPNSSVVTNVTTSLLDAASAGLGQLGLEAPSYIAASSVAGEQVLVGGSFNGTTLANATAQANPFANLVVMVPPGNVTGATNASRYEALAMPGGGMNGPVSALLTADSGVFVGGNFTGTSDGKTQLAYAAHFNVGLDTWDALDGGLPGPVTAIQALGSDGVLFLGSFPMSSTGITTGSYAVWNLTTKAWEHQRALVSGSLQVALTPHSATPPDLANSTYLAGRVGALAAQSAPGAVTLGSVPSNAIFPVLRPLNYTLQSASNSSTSPARSESFKADYAKMIARWTAALKSPRRPARTPEDEATPSELTSRALAAPSTSVPVGDMYAAAFWSGPSGDWMLLGGQFTSGNATNLGMYPLSNSDGGSSSAGSDSGSGDAAMGSMQAGSLRGLARYPSDSLGTVHSLSVVNDSVYVGFEGGVALYNFTSESWDVDFAPLGATEHKVVVRRIFLRPSTTTLIVAGEFDTAGSLPCSGICLLDTNEHRWTQAPGLSGNVTDISFAENKANTLIVAGSLDVGGVHAALAGWHFGNSTWSAYGSIGSSTDQVPGPAAALAVDNFNPSHILVAGDASSGSSSSSSGAKGNPYLAMWTGTGYDVLDGGASNDSAQLVRGTQISQLTVLPLSKSRGRTSGALESDRVLLISGTLQTAAYGLLGAMLYDGANGWTPWLKTVVAPGSAGNAGVRALSYAATHALRFANNHHLSVGVVICISIFIGLGIVLLLIILALLFALILRRRLSHEPSPFAAIGNSTANRAARKQAPTNASNKSDGTLLSTLEAATERVLAITTPGPGRMLSQRSARNLTPTTSRSGHSGKSGRNGLAARLIPSPTLSHGDRGRREAALTPGEGEHVFVIGAAPVHSGYEHNEVEAELGARGAHIKSWHGMPETYDPNTTSGSGDSSSGHYQSSSAATMSQFGHSESNHSGQQENLHGDLVHALSGGTLASNPQQDPTHGYHSSESSTAAAWRQNLPTHTVNVSDGTRSGNGYTGYNTSSGYATGTGTGTGRQSTSVSGTGRGSSSDLPGRFSTSGYATLGSAPTGSGREQFHRTSTSNDTGYLVSTDSGQAPLPPGIRTLLHPIRDGGSSANASATATRQTDTGDSGHNASGEYSSGAIYSTDSSAPRVGPGFGAIGARFPSDESDAESDEDTGLQSAFHDASNESIEHRDAQHFTAHARYDYQPSTPAELPLSAGQEVTILQSSDLHWWLAQDSSGRTGVVPAGYL